MTSTSARKQKRLFIIGCGPAGSACAITARRLGMAVTIADKAVFPRDKCCGDGLTTGALHLLEELGINPLDIPSWKVINDVWLRGPDGTILELPLPKDSGQFAAVASRIELDMIMRDTALANGATIIEGVGISDIEQHNDGAIVTLDNGSRHDCDYVIAADGMWSPTKKIVCKNNSPMYLGEWHAFRQYLSGVTGNAADRLYVWFEPDLLPGYVWSFPLSDGRVNFGFGILRGGDIAVREMANIWDDLFNRPHIKEALGDGYTRIDRHTAWPIPAMIDNATLSAGRVLFVGDAATAPDPMTGEGIGQAILTGMLAARAIANEPNVSDAYEKSVRKALVADHKMSIFLGRLLSHNRTTRWALWLVNRNDWTRRNFARWMFEDEPRAILLTPRRWHRKFFKRPGAFTDQLP